MVRYAYARAWVAHAPLRPSSRKNRAPIFLVGALGGGGLVVHHVSKHDKRGFERVTFDALGLPIDAHQAKCH